MNEEQKKAFIEIGRQAAYLYNGAFEVFKNSKQAERIVFLFFTAIVFDFIIFLPVNIIALALLISYSIEVRKQKKLSNN